eukprot:CAMPEP_0206565746 /NCGR_PEP_ID=MMETSP0325_2-20121206/24257_1 /ASSEMBLY_ACC=CAM_ASM_000347 /TAXON_ID=2866 /ORGANISM="Crypthecodinium cohnii, Strain Seligo" /LENGTH=127 /DNA_ID=CAMNT_0054068665 /DNA_START=739 /DNA_END=1122 /DNA_ORIENTATION=-
MTLYLPAGAWCGKNPGGVGVGDGAELRDEAICDEDTEVEARPSDTCSNPKALQNSSSSSSASSSGSSLPQSTSISSMVGSAHTHTHTGCGQYESCSGLTVTIVVNLVKSVASPCWATLLKFVTLQST